MSLRQVLVGKSLANSVIRGLSIGAVLMLGSRFFLMPVRAHGISMMPTYSEGQFIFVNRLAYRFSAPGRGDVVAVTITDRTAVLIKRIIGLPGESVRILRGQVFVNGAPLRERYVRFSIPWDVNEVVLAADEVFVVGDNRSMPARHHEFGRVSQSRIIGRAVF